MTEAPEFPQADPAIRYIVEKVSQIENQYACNAQYHKDHKAIKQRLDNLDPVISELRKITSELKNTPRAKDINDIVSALAERSKKQNDKLAKETALINDKFAEFN
jgi:cell shape-determining protein MreC